MNSVFYHFYLSHLLCCFAPCPLLYHPICLSKHYIAKLSSTCDMSVKVVCSKNHWYTNPGSRRPSGRMPGSKLFVFGLRVGVKTLNKELPGRIRIKAMELPTLCDKAFVKASDTSCPYQDRISFPGLPPWLLT